MIAHLFTLCAALAMPAASPALHAAPSPAAHALIAGTQETAAAASNDEPDDQDGERATEWPVSDDAAAIKRSVSKLRKAANPEMEAGGRTEIAAAGAAAAPFLLRSLGKERGEDARERLTEALDSVTTAKYTRLLAEFFGNKSDAVRRYTMRRVAMLGDPGLRETAEELLTDLEVRAADPKARKKVAEIDLDLAAVLCVGCGSQAGLARVMTLAVPKQWIKWRSTLRPVAASARAAGDEIGRAIAGTLLGATDPSDRVAALNLLAYAGDDHLARAVRPSLDAEENHVKVAAINALRMMVDGDPPLDRLSTFDAIERANKWKSRL